MQLNTCFTSENIVQSFSQFWGIAFGIYCWSVKDDEWNFNTLKSCADAKTVSGKSEKDSKILGLSENDTSKSQCYRQTVYWWCRTTVWGRGYIFLPLNRGAQVILRLCPVSKPDWVSQSKSDSYAAGCPSSWGLSSAGLQWGHGKE